VAESEAAEEPAAAEPETQEPTQMKFAIQLGSYPNVKEAQKRVSTFSKRGLKTEVRTAVVNAETRYRVVMPGFKSRKIAESKGKELKSARKIENFVIIKAE
jgi:cell division protein FtsN